MVKRAPLTETEKQYVMQRKRAGASLPQIARELGCSDVTARKWWRHGRDGYQPRRRGRPALGILSSYPTPIGELAVALKRSSPHWGPANIKLEMEDRLGVAAAELPSAARLAALFKERCPEAVQPRQHTNYPEKPAPTATHSHQRWQADAQEKIRLTSGELATILNVRDEYCGAIIASRAFITTTLRGWRKLTLGEVQSSLRQAFEEWGCPCKIQTDHEIVYTGAPDSDFPSRFTLWLQGLNIAHVPSRLRRPTDQAEVERTHRTVGDMAWKDEPCATVEQLQALLDHRRQRYNHRYPSHASHCHGQPPLVACPTASHSGRPFRTDLEWEIFSMERVEHYLATRVWTRQVTDSGGVSFGHQSYPIGRAYAGQTVAVRYRPETHTVSFQFEDGSVAEQPVRHLTQADLIGYVTVETLLLEPFQLSLQLEGV